jgi:benzoyl-CoA reductase subunit D
MLVTAGIDVGTGCVKVALFEVQGGQPRWLAKGVERIRQRDPYRLASEMYDALLADARLSRRDVAYVATTGDGENVPFATGHFYSMTTHARGAVYLDPSTRAVLDIGALHGRAIRTDGRGKVLSYRMTSQCASGSGQFLENIARYLGIAQDEIGALSQQGKNPEKVSSICAVLAETDVINMVSRGVSAANILRGIHVSMAGRLASLVKGIAAVEGTALMTGGLALDSGLVGALRDALAEARSALEVKSHPDSIHAGAIGAALWGAFRHEKLQARGQAPASSAVEAA